MDLSGTDLRNQIKPLWKKFVDETESFRSELFRFGLSLTRNPFDAEDLVADSLLKAFTFCAINDNTMDNPRAFITKVMVTGWIDEQRRVHPTAIPVDLASEENDLPDTKTAANRLFVLEPRSRAVVVLKEVLGYTHKEVAAILSITPENAKVIMHRAKSELAEAPHREPRASRACVQRFVDAFLTYDVDEIRKVLIEDVVAENFPIGSGTGVEYHIENGWVRGSFFHHDPGYEVSGTPYPLELEVKDVFGEPIVLVFRDRAGAAERMLEEVWLLEEVDGQVAKITDYCFRPDFLRWVADHLGLKYRPLEMGDGLGAAQTESFSS